jgi:hypothetical protein
MAGGSGGSRFGVVGQPDRKKHPYQHKCNFGKGRTGHQAWARSATTDRTKATLIFYGEARYQSEVVVDGAIFLVVVGAIVGLSAVSTVRRRVRLKNAPTGSRRTVTTKVANTDEAIRRWAKLGYDLEQRSDYESHTGRMGVPETRATLTFIKR